MWKALGWFGLCAFVVAFPVVAVPVSVVILVILLLLKPRPWR
jgi:hypothetical protein